MGRLLAFIDEAGQRPATKLSSAHFVPSAVAFDEDDRGRVAALLAGLRSELGRRPSDPLHWRNYSGHGLRLRAAQTLGSAEFVTLSSVVVAKPFLTDPEWVGAGEMTYLLAFGYLLERLSWIARDRDSELHYTLAHVVHFPTAKLRGYEANLRTSPRHDVAWAHVLRGGDLDQPSRLEELQLADLAASATFAAFEPDRFKNTEDRYLRLLAPRLYRGRSNRLTSYGVKMVPWSEACKAAYPFLAAL